MNKKFKYLFFVFLFLVFHILLFLNLEFTAWPEMLTYPWLISQSYDFYKDIVHPYLPGLPYLLLAFYSVLGLTVRSLKCVTLLFVLASDLLVWLISKKIYGESLAIVSLGLFIPLQLFFEGNGLWFDLASMPFILFTFYLLIDKKTPKKRKKVILAGLSMGLAILIKQTNIIFLIPSVITLLPYRKMILKLVLSVIFPLAIVAIFYLVLGTFREFFYWGLWYPLFILPRMPEFALVPTIKQGIAVLVLFSPALLLVKKKSIPLIWFLVSFFFAIPRFAYFHLQHAAAFLCLLIPSLSSYYRHKYYKILIAAYIFLVGGLFIQFAVRDWRQPIRFFEPNVMSTRQELAQKIPRGEVYFYNVPSQYFVGTNILPMKSWVDTFPWYLELQGMQGRIISEMEKQQVQLVAYSEFSKQATYELGSYQPKLVDEYIWQNYSREMNINDKIWLLRRRKF